jgi:S-adenosylmethionine-dependent methyltransferase
MLKAYPPGFMQTEGGPQVIETEIETRPFWFRKRYVPWLMSHMDLCRTKVLEVGAGTGTSAIPLAEKGALVDSIDINPRALEIARVRASLHGLDVRFQVGNAEEIATMFPGAHFDLIVYFAALEHMTYNERIATLRSAWAMLKPGAFLAVVDTPNRLWYYDNHTSLTHFFHWLPTEVAIDYARLTPRGGFNAEFNSPDAGAALRMERWGRGVSFHDFEIALGALEGLEISGEWEFRRKHDRAWAKWWAETNDGRYHEFLKAVSPQTATPFLEEELALSIRKPRG